MFNDTDKGVFMTVYKVVSCKHIFKQCHFIVSSPVMCMQFATFHEGKCLPVVTAKLTEIHEKNSGSTIVKKGVHHNLGMHHVIDIYSTSAVNTNTVEPA